MKILAIDPGCTESAYVLMDEKYRPLEFGKVANAEMRKYLTNAMRYEKYKDEYYTETAIEMVASYGMAVGKEVFETCVWIGRFTELSRNSQYVYRKDVKLNLCGQTRAKDSNVIQALKDRFGDKGTTKAPGWFYGFKKDIWQAYAVGVTYLDTITEGIK